MSHKVTRVFHPVGQGAFYSESHDVDGQKFSIIYDCGSFNVRQGTKVVEGTFDENEIIDILFISHFDFDHISLLQTLIRRCQIRKVVLPLLHEDVRFALSGYYHYRMARNHSMQPFAEKSLQLLNDPRSVFQDERASRDQVEFVFVRPYVEPDAEHNQERRDQLNAAEEFANSQRRNRIINSRSESDANSLSSFVDWMFLPYNMDYFNRNKDLVQNLIEWLKQNHYSLENLNDGKFFDREHCKQLAGIYKSLKGSINENSMLLFSGPLQQQNQCEVSVMCHAYQPLWCFSGHWLVRQPGCLYSGDFNLKQESLSQSYGPYFDRIGTVQVPHHGSEHSFDLDSFYARGMICPVSSGVTKRFGHPDRTVIDEIVCAGGIPIGVTNDRFSEFKEVILL